MPRYTLEDAKLKKDSELYNDTSYELSNDISDELSCDIEDVFYKFLNNKR